MKSTSKRILELLGSVLEKEAAAVQNVASLGPDDIVRYLRLYLANTGGNTSNMAVEDLIQRLMIDANPKQKQSLTKALDLVK